MARLIDADALVDKLRRSVEETRFEWMEQALRYRDKVIFAIDCVSEAHTIDAAPVRRGEWEKEPYLLGWTHRCNRCGENYGMPHGMFNFCPNCGADMRGETDGRSSRGI